MSENEINDHILSGSGWKEYWRGNLAANCYVHEEMEEEKRQKAMMARGIRSYAWMLYEQGKAELAQRRVEPNVCSYLIKPKS